MKIDQLSKHQDGGINNDLLVSILREFTDSVDFLNTQSYGTLIKSEKLVCTLISHDYYPIKLVGILINLINNPQIYGKVLDMTEYHKYIHYCHHHDINIYYKDSIEWKY